MRKGEVAAEFAATDLVFEMAPAHCQWDELVTSWDGELLQSWGWGEFKSRTGWTASRMLCLRNGMPVAAAQWLWRPVPLLGSPRIPAARAGHCSGGKWRSKSRRPGGSSRGAARSRICTLGGTTLGRRKRPGSSLQFRHDT